MRILLRAVFIPFYLQFSRTQTGSDMAPGWVGMYQNHRWGLAARICDRYLCQPLPLQSSRVPESPNCHLESVPPAEDLLFRHQWAVEGAGKPVKALGYMGRGGPLFIFGETLGKMYSFSSNQ